MWENMMHHSDGEKRENELIGVVKFWGGLSAMGSRSCQYYGMRESALSILDGLVNKMSIILYI